MLSQPGAAACSWTIVDAGQASNTISPGPATIQTETAYAGGPFYNELAWCAVANDGNYPLMEDTESLSALRACSYTTRPPSKLTLSPVATTTCFSTTSTADSNTLIVVPSQACACVKGDWAAFYPFTSGNDGCVFTTVPSSTVTFSTSTSMVAPSPTPTMIGHGCSGDGQACENGDAGDCDYQCVDNYAVSSSVWILKITGGHAKYAPFQIWCYPKDTSAWDKFSPNLWEVIPNGNCTTLGGTCETYYDNGGELIAYCT